MYTCSMVKLRHQVIHEKQRKAKLRKRKTRASRENKDQALVVRKLDSAIHQINRYAEDKYYDNQ